jgi:hypothetical protein
MSTTPPVPVINPNNPFTIWNMFQIYNPSNPVAPAVYVPNVYDLIVDYDQGLFKVTAVDYTTGQSTWESWTLPLAPPSGNDDDDVLLGAGPGTIADSYRIFINSAVQPATLALDRRLRIYGSTTAAIKVFKGTDISDNGTIISQFYDTNWNLLGDNIPLELVAMNNTTNTAVKSPKVGYTQTLMNDGELCTVVAYDDVGGAVSTAKFVVQNSSFIRKNEDSLKYIVSITLQSPFLDPSDPTNVLFPINMPVQNLPMMGVVTYSDGSTSSLPVDGTKFAMAGLSNYIATRQGQTIPLVLLYNLSTDEYNYIGTPSTNNTITQAYTATTDAVDGAYSVFMFAYPVWVSAQVGYRLQVFLYNLDRQDVYDVTSLVTADTDTATFNPLQYNVVQNLRLAVNMNQVDAAFKAWRYVQTIGITLLRPGSDNSGDNWTIAFSPGQSPQYGVGVVAKATYVEVNNWSLDISCGMLSQSAWLDKVYFATQPLYDPMSEVVAPSPNIMSIVVNNTPYEFPVSQWNQALTVTTQLPEGTDIFIEWIYRDGQNDQQLGCSGLIIHQVNGGV